MVQLNKSTSAALAAVFVCLGMAYGQTFDSHAQYSGTQGSVPGTWWYKEYAVAGGAYNNLTYIGPYWLGTGLVGIYQDAVDYFQMPTAERDAVRQWEAPASGLVAISSYENVRMYYNNQGGNGVSIRIYRNDQLMLDQFLAPNDTTGFALSASFGVDQNDVLSFQAHALGNAVGDIIKFDPVITLATSASPFEYDSYDFYVNNPGVNGQFLYFECNPETQGYAPLTWQTSPYPHWQASNQYAQIYRTGDNPPNIVQAGGGGLDIVRLWVAPCDGLVEVVASPNGGDVRMIDSPTSTGDGVLIQMHRNFLMFYERKLDREGPNSSISLDDENIRIRVNAGDILHFHMNKYYTTWYDSANFDFRIKLYPSRGYDPAGRTWDSEQDFQDNASHTQGFRDWSYMYAPVASMDPADFVAMSWLGAPDNCWEGGNNWCRVFGDYQHPGYSFDSARVWTAPEAGYLTIESLSNVRRWWGTDGDGSALKIYKNDEELRNHFIPHDNSIQIPVITGIHVLEGDKIAFRNNCGAASNSLGDFLYTEFKLTLDPTGPPPMQTVVVGDFGDPQHAGDTVINTPTAWFRKHYQIHGDLTFDDINGIPGILLADSCEIELMSEYSREYFVRWYGGQLETYNTKIGGRMYPGNGMTVNFNIEGPWKARQRSHARVHYGLLIFDGGALDAVELIAGEGAGEVILAGDGVVSLEKSYTAIGFTFPAHINDPPNTITFDLPIDEVIPSATYADRSRYQQGQEPPDLHHIPGAAWELKLKNHVSPSWFMNVNHVHDTGPAKLLEFERCGLIFPQLHTWWEPGKNVDADVYLPGAVWPGYCIQPGSDVTFSNTTWRALNADSLYVPLWSLYANNNADDIRVQPGSWIGECMIWGDGQIAINGTPCADPPDTFVSATTMNNHKAGTIEVSDASVANVGGLEGQITAEDDSVITLEHVQLGDVELKTYAPAAPYTIGGVITLCDYEEVGNVRYAPWDAATGGLSIREVFDCVTSYAWSFISQSGWMNWDTGWVDGQGRPWWGFQGTTWAIVDVSGEPGNKAMRPYYCDIASKPPNTFFDPRIVAPGVQPADPYATKYDFSPRCNDSVYLAMRIKIHQQTRHQDGLLKLCVQGCTGQWQNMGDFYREMWLVSDDAYHTYVWDLNDPDNNEGGTISDTYFAYTYAQPWADNMTYWGLIFRDTREGHDNNLLGPNDYVEIDFVDVVTKYDHYLPVE